MQDGVRLLDNGVSGQQLRLQRVVRGAGSAPTAGVLTARSAPGAAPGAAAGGWGCWSLVPRAFLTAQQDRCHLQTADLALQLRQLGQVPAHAASAAGPAAAHIAQQLLQRLHLLLQLLVFCRQGRGARPALFRGLLFVARRMQRRLGGTTARRAHPPCAARIACHHAHAYARPQVLVLHHSAERGAHDD